MASKIHPMELITSRLILRDFQESDFPALLAIESLPETHYFEGPVPTEAETWAKREKNLQRARDIPRTHYRLAICLSTGEFVGRLGLGLQNESIREWEIGWAILPQEWGKGYATEAARRLLEHVFDELNAHRVVAFCHASNAASERVMRKLGMKQDGYLRETRWWNDDWADELVYSILEWEWKQANL